MIKRIKFLGIPVRDQDRALKFYTEILGFRLLTDQQFSESQRWIELSIPGADTGSRSSRQRVTKTGSGPLSTHPGKWITSTKPTPSCKGKEWNSPARRKSSHGHLAVMKDSEGNQIVLSARS